MNGEDYVALAAALLNARKYCETDNQRRGVERAVRCIANTLTWDNPSFDLQRFLRACGVQS